jgi:hypothetical protein
MYNVHIGLGKTGSTFIQTMIQRNLKVLKSENFAYPKLSWPIRRQSRSIISGNVLRWKYINAFSHVDHIYPSGSKFLFSSEFLFDRIPDEMSSFENLVRKRGCRFLLFLRDPVELTLSGYSQCVRGESYIGSFEDFLGEMILYFQGVANTLEYINGLDIKVSVENYSTCRSNLWSVFESWLGISISPPALLMPNRSLFKEEIEIVKKLNSVNPKLGSIIALKFTEKIPDYTGTPVTCDNTTALRYVNDIKESIQKINYFLSSENQLRLSSFPNLKQSTPLSPAHFELLKIYQVDDIL